MFQLIRRFFCKLAGTGLIALLALAAGCTPTRESAPLRIEGKGTIVVEMTGFRNDHGKAWVLLFAGPDGFPNNAAMALRDVKTEIHDGRAEITFNDLPFGYYAVSVLHDENDDNRMDTSLLGFPAEGFGVSNGLGHRFSPPDFEEARFMLLIDRLVVPVKVQYLEDIRDERRKERRGE